MKKKVTIKNTLFSIILQIVTIISGFIIPRLLLKTFGSEVNGLVSSLTQFLSYITIIEGGITAVILANLYKPVFNKNKKKISSIVVSANNFFRKIALIFVAYTLILAIVYPLLIKSNFSFKYIFTLTLILSVNLFMQYFFSITWKVLLQADKKVSIVCTVQILCIILNTIGVYVMVHLYPNIHIIKLLTAMVYLLQPILFNYYVKRHYDIDKSVVPDKNALSQRWDGFGINFAAFIHNNTDVAILTIFTNLKSVSVYSVHFLVVQGLKSLVTSISGGINPTLGQAYASNDKKRLNEIFDMYELLIYFFSFLLFIIGGLCINSFVKLYTSGVHDANYYQPVMAWLLILAELVFCLREPYVNMAYSANKFKEVSKFAYIEATINIVLSLILVYKFGLVGVAIGTLVAMSYRTIAHIVYLKSNILNRRIMESFKILIVFLIPTLLIIFISNRFITINEISLISWIVFAIKNSILAFIIYLATIIIFQKNKIKLIINKIKVR